MTARHMNRTTRILTVTGASLALAMGSLAGLTGPANAAPAGGGGDCSGISTAPKEQKDLNDGPWREAHGTAPVGYTKVTPAGHLDLESGQDGVGSSVFKLRVSDLTESRNAPDGTYEVKIGDGTCGQFVTAEAKDGKMDLSGNSRIGGHGPQMVQVRGPLTPEAAKGAVGGDPYLGADGKPSALPQVERGMQYSPEKVLSPLSMSPAENEGAYPTGVSPIPKGSDEITFDPSSTYPAPLEDSPQVDITYRDAKTNDAVTVRSGAAWTRSSTGNSVLKGGVLKDLPSGRYTFSFTDRHGEKQHFFVMVTDEDRQKNAADDILYADPF